MNTFRLPIHSIVLVFLFLGLVCGLSDQAAGKPRTPPPPPDHRILITAVDVAKQQITIVFKNTGQKEVYIVDDLTHVTVENNPGSIKDIQVGQEIFAYVERDSHTLDSLTVGAADPAPSNFQ